MSRLFQFLGIFLLAALVAHLAYVLLLPPRAANALITDLRQALGENAFQVLNDRTLRRIVRHPVAEATYGACVLRLDEKSVVLTGPDLRTMWAITVYSPRGDVIYAVNDRLVPEGQLRVRFEYRKLKTSRGEIALPKLEGRTLILPLQHATALMLLEVWPWHPGQTDLVRQLVHHMRCLTVAPMRPRRRQQQQAIVPPSKKIPLPRPRPKRPAGAQ